MIEFLIDQNFNENIIDGMARRDATLEFTHVRDVDLATAHDPDAWLVSFHGGWASRPVG